MDVDIKVPPLGESVTEATVAKWYKKKGEEIKTDELLVELETDKVTLEVNAATSGVLSRVDVAEGSVVKIGQILGAIAEGVTSNNAPIDKKPEAQTPTPPVVPEPAPKKEEVIASPAARKIALENNISSTEIPASGKDNRVTKSDVINYMQTSNSSNKVASGLKQEERVKMTRLRKRIAERLKESQNNAAILTTFNEIDMSKVMAFRNKYKDLFEKKYQIKLGFMSFFVKAAVIALKEIPSVNAQIEGDEIIYKNYYDIGVAVGTDQGLVVPVVRESDKLTFAGVEKTIGDLGKKARDGKLSMEDLTGGTFTISNGGTYGSLLSTPIINPPQSAILGMHKIQDRPVAIDGKIEIRPMMYVALSYDHRLIDGKEAVTFLVKVKEYVENPERLLFDLMCEGVV